MFSLESSEPGISRCDCCGGLSVRHTRFVLRDGDAYGVYYARYSNNHPDDLLEMLVVLGAWGEGTTAADRTAFFCRVQSAGDSYEVMLGGVEQSVWAGLTIADHALTREQALEHPLKSACFEVVDFGLQADGCLRGFLERVESGDVAAPLERSFQVPDEVFALGPHAEGRCELLRNFVSLDGERFFVRCLLTIPVEHYGAWSIGIWVEVSGGDSAQIREVWEKLDAYGTLRFEGTLANDLVGMGLPVAAGTAVVCHVPDPDAPPRVEAPMTGPLAELLGRTWDQENFEQFAVAHGML